MERTGEERNWKEYTRKRKIWKVNDRGGRAGEVEKLGKNRSGGRDGGLEREG